MLFGRTYIKLSNGVKIMDLSHTQPKLLDAEHAWGTKFKKNGKKQYLKFVVT